MNRKTILLCATARSGSSYLGSLFQENGVGWLGESLYNPISAKKINAPNVVYAPLYNKKFDKLLLKEYIKESHKTHNGRIVIKIMGSKWEDILSAIGGDANITEYFGDVTYVYLTRNDRWRQAISLDIARKTKRWRKSKDDTKQVVPKTKFNFQSIKKMHHKCNAENNVFKRFFEMHSINPIRITYEELDQDYVTTFKSLMTKLGTPIEAVKDGTLQRQETELDESFYQQVMDHRDAP
jgi:LPS sulfotransferase NodH